MFYPGFHTHEFKAPLPLLLLPPMSSRSPVFPFPAPIQLGGLRAMKAPQHLFV